MTLRVTLLGPPRIERDGAAMAVDTRKAIALLAFLALSPRAHSRDALAELLWPAHDAEHARGALRRTLSTLRRAIGEQHVEAARERVALVGSDGGWIDVHRFRALSAPAASDDDLAAAAALFGGDLLEGFSVRDSAAFDHWQQREADGLRRELGSVLGRLTDACGRRGDTTAAIRHARRRLELDPLHEPAHRALIALLAQSGDRGAAFDQYRTCVRVLSAELGVAPVVETTALYEAISEGGSGGEPQAPVRLHSVPTAPEAPRPLVGRDEPWDALLAAHDAVAADGRIVVIEGEPGIGKTRLATAFLDDAGARGAVTLAGQCYEQEVGLAYAPVIDVLRARLHGDRGWLAAVSDHAVAELARMLPELAELRPGSPSSAPPDGPGAEGRFLEALAEALAAATAGALPGALLIEDLQWADAGTLSLLGYLGRRLARRPLLLLLTWRTPRDARLRGLLGPAEGAGGVRLLGLARLGAGDVAELVRGACPRRSSPELERRLFDETEGVPFLVVEYLAALEAAGPAGEGVWSLPAGARELIRARVDPLGDVAGQVLSAAAVLGRSFAVDTIREVAGRSEEETVGGVEELVRHGLVSERPRPAQSGYDFAHEKVRTVVYEETSLARRRLLHGRCAAALAADGPVRDEQAASIAGHLRLAGRDGDAALEYARAAAYAATVHATADARAHLRAALALGHPEPVRLHVAVGDLCVLSGDYGGALTAYETAAAGSASQDLAAIEHRLGDLHRRRGAWELAQARLEAALAAAGTGDDALRARVHADLSLTAHAQGDSARASDQARRAQALAEASGDTRALSQALNLLGILARGAGALDEARSQLERSAALSRELGDLGAHAAALNNLARTRRAQGDSDAAIALTREALALCVRQGDRHRQAALENNLADLLHDAGDGEAAMEHLKRAVVIFADVGADSGPQPEIWKLAEW